MMVQPLPPVTTEPLNRDDLPGLIGASARTVLDIGAHDGKDSHKLKNLFPSATVYAFEPDPRALFKFKLRPEDERIRLFETAIGAEDGEAPFHTSGGMMPGATPEQLSIYRQGWDKSGSLHAPKDHKLDWPWVTFGKTIRVPVQRLDTWAKANGVTNVDFIWADVQGAEAELIAGGRETFKTARWFYTEYGNVEWYEGQPTLRQILELLPAYVIHTLYPTDVMLRNTAISSRTSLPDLNRDARLRKT